MRNRLMRLMGGCGGLGGLTEGVQWVVFLGYSLVLWGFVL